MGSVVEFLDPVQFTRSSFRCDQTVETSDLLVQQNTSCWARKYVPVPDVSTVLSTFFPGSNSQLFSFEHLQVPEGSTKMLRDARTNTLLFLIDLGHDGASYRVILLFDKNKKKMGL